MAFCNSCGATLDGGAKFCSKCGTTQPVNVTATRVNPPTTAPRTAPQNNNALKIILIVVAVVVGLGILGIATVSFIGYRIARHSRIHNENGNVRVETPFGSVNTTTDPQEAARSLGLDAYPGAEVVKGSTSDLAMGNMHTTTADFETSDPVSTVADFYKSKVPNASVVSSSGDHFSLISTDKKNVLTIIIEPKNGRTRIHISKISGKMVTGGDSDSN
ncbi:MAG: zinc ribbon domain-containing protein [Terriglobales bacterium]